MRYLTDLLTFTVCFHYSSNLYHLPKVFILLGIFPQFIMLQPDKQEYIIYRVQELQENKVID